MTITCNRPYSRVPLDRAFVARELGLDENELSRRLHKLKRSAGLQGDDRVTICLDDGEVYVSRSSEAIGSLYES
jgi:CRP-like cAMP-binding protein